MANYRYYIARSKSALDDPTLPNMDFHLRIRLDSDENNPPYLQFDSNASQEYEVEVTTNGDQTHYTISVWLEEISTKPIPSLVYKDAVFTTNNPPDYDQITVEIIAYIKPSTGPSYSRKIPSNINDDLVVDPMDSEYPIDDPVQPARRGD